MQLEKRNETVWSIKRKENPGRFILRATEEGGKIIQVAIGLENGQSSIAFQMNHAEFANFYGIISSFKDLVESPDGVAIQSTVEKPKTESKVSAPIPLSLDGSGSPLAEESTALEIKAIDTAKELDEGIASLETLDQGESMLEVVLKSEEVIQNVPPGRIIPVVSSMNETPSINNTTTTTAIASQQNTNKPTALKSPDPINAIKTVLKSETTTPAAAKKDDKRLKETDWDPW